MPYLPEELVTPDQHAYLNLISELQAFRREWRTEMAELSESVTRLFADVSNEIQQVRDGLQGTIDALVASGEAKDATIAELQARVDELDALKATVSTEQARIDAKSEELEANDPAPADEA